MNPKKVFFVAILIFSLAMLPTIVNAQSGTTSEKNPVVGGWLFKMTRPNLPLVLNLATLTADGNAIIAAPGPLTAGHGVWLKTGKRDYLLSFTFILFDLTGQGPQSFLKVSSKITLSRDGNSGTGRFKSVFMDLTGNVWLTEEGTIQSERILPEPID